MRMFTHHTIMCLLTLLVTVMVPVGIVRRHHVDSRSITEHVIVIRIHVEGVSDEIVATTHNVIGVIH